MFYILKGRYAFPCKDIRTWATKFEDGLQHKHIGDTYIYGARISTVFLGLDHQYGNGPPLLFETMVFGGKLDQAMDRYSTYIEAEKGHARMVKAVKKSRGLFLSILLKLLFIK